jgi:hypothetical protein
MMIYVLLAFGVLLLAVLLLVTALILSPGERLP